VHNSPEIPGRHYHASVSQGTVWRENRGDQPTGEASVIVKTLANDDGNEIGLT
jgi:hypothetical protein